MSHVQTLLTALEQKRLATAKARAALRGIVLQVIESDAGRPEFIASLHALTRAFTSLGDVETWLNRIEGVR